MQRILVALTIAALSSGVTGQTPPQGQTVASASGAIGGTVIDTATGQPIEGAVVHIAPTSGALPAPLQMTDGRGRFLFTSLAAGSYSLRASKSGYSEGAYGADADNGVTVTPIAIDTGQHFLTARISMARPSAISGVVTDETGEPMVGVFVRALRVVTLAGLPQMAAGRVVTTDDRGAYRLSGLAAGRYIVMLPSVSAAAPAAKTSEVLAASRESQARSITTIKQPRPDGAFAGQNGYVLISGAYPLPPGREPRAYPPLFHPAGRVATDALPVVLAPGEERGGVNFAWAPVPASTVSGRLVGPADAVGHILIRLAPSGAESLPAGGEAATTVSMGDGSFTFLRVPHGEYTLIASRAYAYLSDGDGRTLPRPPGYKDGSGGGAEIPGSEVGYSYLGDQTIDTHTARQAVTVSAGTMNGLAVQLRPNVQLRGRVIIESGAFSISGASGGSAMPPSTGPVRAEPANGDLTLGVPGGRFDGNTGTFYVDGLQGSEYTLRFMGLPMVKSITIAGADYTNRPIDTVTTRGLDEIVVTVTDKVATLSGTVLGRDGRREPSAVIYFPTDRAQWSRYGLRPTRIGSASVTSSGSFRVDLPAGDYFVVAVPAAQNRLWQDPKWLAAASALASRVTLVWDQKRTETFSVRDVR